MEKQIITTGIIGWLNRSLARISPDAALIYRKKDVAPLTARERLDKRKDYIKLSK